MNKKLSRSIFMGNSDWFIRPQQKNNSKLNIFCFPYAGGSASSYLPWADYLPESVELFSVQPPGRSSRMFEKPFTRMGPLVEDFLEEFSKFTNTPYILFGHSLGSRIAYELMVSCQTKRIRLPEHFIISGSRGAHISYREDPIYNLSDEEFVSKLKELNGTPTEILENKELMNLCLPTLRADFEIADTYSSSKVILDCATTIIGGQEDHNVSYENLNCWNELFINNGDIHLVPGDHFFIDKNRAAVLHLVNQVIKNVLNNLATDINSNLVGTA